MIDDRRELPVSSGGREGDPLTRMVVSCLIALALLAVGMAAGMSAMWFLRPEIDRALASAAPLTQTGDDEESVRQDGAALLWEIWDLLEREYIDPEALDDQEMIYGAASGLVATLGDSPTMFVEPASAAIMNQDMQGSFEGIGATVDTVDGRLTIIRPLPDSPAMEAGLEAGDVILAVDDVSLEGKSTVEAISLIRGPKGSVVRLLVQREGVAEPFVVPVTRDEVELSTVEFEMLDGGVAYLSLTEFNAVSANRIHQALRELLSENPVGIIFDLRHNPGGFLQMAVDISGEFLPDGALVLTERQRDVPEQDYRVKGLGLATEIPLVVLVDGASASASEIVAGAIQHHNRGVLVGQSTFGKGSVQNTHTLGDGSSLRVTIAKWYLPNGDNLDGQGIVPDFDVAITAEDVSAGSDPQLDRAMDYLLNGERS